VLARSDTHHWLNRRWIFAGYRKFNPSCGSADKQKRPDIAAGAFLYTGLN
jgi:hypothetical protein